MQEIRSSEIDDDFPFQLFDDPNEFHHVLDLNDDLELDFIAEKLAKTKQQSTSSRFGMLFKQDYA